MKAAATLLVAVFLLAACDDDDIDPGATCRRGCGLPCPGGAEPTQSELVTCLQACDAAAAFADKAECKSELADLYGCQDVNICHSADSTCDETQANYTRCAQDYCNDHESVAECSPAYAPSP